MGAGRNRLSSATARPAIVRRRWRSAGCPGSRLSLRARPIAWRCSRAAPSRRGATTTTVSSVTAAPCPAARRRSRSAACRASRRSPPAITTTLLCSPMAPVDGWGLQRCGRSRQREYDQQLDAGRGQRLSHRRNCDHSRGVADSFALLPSGTVEAWGYNSSGQLGLRQHHQP